MKKVLLIDNYDSFTWNLVQYLQELGTKVSVYKNDEISDKEAKKLNPDFLIFSPGPGNSKNKKDIGNSLSILEIFKGKIPILGVCLGHQMIAEYFSGTVEKTRPAHGQRWLISILKSEGIFKNFPSEIIGMRYHSLIVSSENFPKDLEITANTEDGKIMALQNSKERIFGIQFHPESIGTKMGIKILKNFLNT